MDGVKLRFENGLAVEATAEKNEAYLLSQLNVDEGARRLGEFAIGTNMGVNVMTRNILFDEKIGGSIHMALGRSYEEVKGSQPERDPLGYGPQHEGRRRDLDRRQVVLQSRQVYGLITSGLTPSIPLSSRAREGEERVFSPLHGMERGRG